MKITYTVNISIDSKKLQHAYLQAGLGISEKEVEERIIGLLNGASFAINLDDQIKDNPNILAGIIQMLKVSFDSKPTEPMDAAESNAASPSEPGQPNL